MRLSAAQEGALVILDAEPERWRRRGGFRSGLRTNTLDSLVALGLVERRQAPGWTLESEYRISPAGRRRLDGAD